MDSVRQYEKFQTLLNRAGHMTITPGGKTTILVGYWLARFIRLCDAPRLGIAINSGATIPSDTLEDERETAFRIQVRS